MNLDLFADFPSFSIESESISFNPIGFNFTDSFEDKVSASRSAIKRYAREKHLIISTSFGILLF